MQISEHDIEEFKNLYCEEFGIYLLENDAQEIAANVIGLYTLLAKKLPSEHEGTATTLPSQE